MSKPFAYWVRLATVATLCTLVTFNPVFAGRLLDRLLHRNNCAPACPPCQVVEEPCCVVATPCSPCDTKPVQCDQLPSATVDHSHVHGEMPHRKRTRTMTKPAVSHVFPVSNRRYSRHSTPSRIHRRLKRQRSKPLGSLLQRSRHLRSNRQK